MAMEQRKIIFNIAPGDKQICEIEYRGEFTHKDLYTLFAQCLVKTLEDTPPVERLKVTRALIPQMANEVAASATRDALKSPELFEDIMALIAESACGDEGGDRR